MIKPLDFQQEVISFLLNTIADPQKKDKIIIKSPTGSGKTITLLKFIEEYLNNIDKDTIFCWFTPGTGELEEQSKDRMSEHFPHMLNGDIFDILLQGFKESTTYFINWEMVTNKKNNALKESERKNLFNRISEAHRHGKKFIVIIDEEHLNNTTKANDVLNALGSIKEIRVSATTKEDESAEFYEVKEEKVITSGLITKALYINEDIDSELEFNSYNNEAELLIDRAISKRNAIREKYIEIDENINPLVLIQFPNKSDELIDFVENFLESKGYSYDNNTIGKWLDRDEYKINIDDITKNDSPQCFLLIKQAVATGWDCPRAKVLVKLKDRGSEQFEIQTLGRIRRMPMRHHYEIDLLDFCYLYTFDEEYKNKSLQIGNAYEVKRLNLKKVYNGINLGLNKETRDKDYNYVDDRESLKKIYDAFIKTYNLKQSHKDNFDILKVHGFNLSHKLKGRFKTGKFITLSSVEDKDNGKYGEIYHEVNTHVHGIHLLHALDVFKQIIGLESKKTKVIFQHMFHKNIRSNYKILSLNNKEWYAFIINNQDKIKDFLNEISIKPENVQLQFLPKKLINYKLPLEEIYRYVPSKIENDTNIVTNVYEGYSTAMIVDKLRSNSEQLFERYCEVNENIQWYYKNGDSGQQYLSIIYLTNLGKQYLFYPDYIVQDKQGRIWIIETKGGEHKDKSKNIDKQVHNKFIALKKYAEQNKVQWGFVRDKNNNLYINNTNYSENMDTENWINLNKEL